MLSLSLSAPFFFSPSKFYFHKKCCNTKYESEAQENEPFKEFMVWCREVEGKICFKGFEIHKEPNTLISGGVFTHNKETKLRSQINNWKLTSFSCISADGITLYSGRQWGSVRLSRWARNTVLMSGGAEVKTKQADFTDPLLITTLILLLWRLSLLIS